MTGHVKKCTGSALVKKYTVREKPEKEARVCGFYISGYQKSLKMTEKKKK